jgi:hypothetical protein
MIRRLALFGTFAAICACTGPIYVVRGGPPVHAKAYGVRTRMIVYEYYYYPDVEVYFCPTRQVYHCLSGGVWIEARVRPAVLAPGVAYVTVSLEGEKPYVHHASVRAKHPPGQVKKGAAPPPGKAKPPGHPGKGKGRWK